MYSNHRFPNFPGLFRRRPQAMAVLSGSRPDSDLQGAVRFYRTTYGVLVVTEMAGLPVSDDKCAAPVFAFHIHEGNSCTGNATDPFANARAHYNPRACRHPYHAGDLPPLFGAAGYAFSAVLTDRFTVEEVIGKTVILHAMPDDFTTQPSGNAGAKIACGEIVAV